jgi:hypothetical protein
MNSSSFAGRRLTLTLADDRIRVPAGIQPGERFGDVPVVASRSRRLGQSTPPGRGVSVRPGSGEYGVSATRGDQGSCNACEAVPIV